MKALVDQNLSFRLVEILLPRFPGTCHVRDVGLAGEDDERIWQFAKAEGFVIVTKDNVFLRGLLSVAILHRLSRSVSRTPRLAASRTCCNREPRTSSDFLPTRRNQFSSCASKTVALTRTLSGVKESHALAWNYSLDQLANDPDLDPAQFDRASHDEA